MTIESVNELHDSRSGTVSEIHDPVSGEIIDTSDVDGLCLALEECKLEAAKLALFRGQCVQALAALTTGTEKTRHLRGKEWRAKIEMPSTTFYQPALRQLVNAYPQYAGEFLRVNGYAVNMMPYKKLAKTTATDPAFAMFAKMLTEAERPATSLPYVTVEPIANDHTAGLPEVEPIGDPFNE